MCNFFFFFRWRYSPLWALACRTIPLHFSLSFTNSLHLLTPSTWRSLSTFYLTLYTVLQELEDSLQLPKYIPSPFQSIIIKSIQLIPLLNFRNNKFFFYCVGLLTPRHISVIVTKIFNKIYLHQGIVLHLSFLPKKVGVNQRKGVGHKWFYFQKLGVRDNRTQPAKES